MRPSLFRATLLSALGCACAPESATGVVVWESETLVYIDASAGEALCAGTAPHLDAYVTVLADQLGVSSDLEAPLHYTYVSSFDDGPCPKTNEGCAIGNEVYSRLPVHKHELVHATIDHLGGTHVAFEEGIAVAYGDERCTGCAPAPAFHELLPYIGDLPVEVYPLAGLFVRRLHDRDRGLELEGVGQDLQVLLVHPFGPLDDGAVRAPLLPRVGFRRGAPEGGEVGR